MRAGDLKPGDWFWFEQVRLCIGQLTLLRTRYCDSPASTNSMNSDTEVELLPPDAGYDYVRPQPIKLEVGKRYVLRNGEVTGPLESLPDNGDFVFGGHIARGFKSWAREGVWSNGRGCRQHELDIVAEYAEQPKPIDPGEGWRLLANMERIIAGDEFSATGKRWIRIDDAYSVWTAHEFCASGESSAIRRRIEAPKPTYRPFASEAEYAPHRDRWLREPVGKDRCKVVRYNDARCWTGIGNLIWENMLSAYVFDDTGLPVGVEVKP